MAEVRDRVVRSLGEVDAEDEELTAVSGEAMQPGGAPNRPGRMPEGTLPDAAVSRDVARVEEALGRTGGATNHPDGPGVGGD